MTLFIEDALGDRWVGILIASHVLIYGFWVESRDQYTHSIYNYIYSMYGV